ncbi:ubiquitin-related domain-containing protein [Artemisia annua]|uniref:Ubiquitin-related domain-containing protein n=1 Tax=Artemisia annua TaxID=35608 RepID=A0A2U1LCY5_ARTAN|nr:ubiquitin-related domain-containing protein [Artemisia annua]
MDSNARVRVKEETEDEVAPTNGSSYINLKVISNLNNLDPYFRVRRDHPLLRVMISWGVRSKVEYNTVRFTYDGVRIDANQTPNDLNMEDDDCIDAWTEQLGGHLII